MSARERYRNRLRTDGSGEELTASEAFSRRRWVAQVYAYSGRLVLLLGRFGMVKLGLLQLVHGQAGGAAGHGQVGELERAGLVLGGEGVEPGLDLVE